MRGMLFFASKPPARSGAEDTYKDLSDIVIPKRFACNKKNRGHNATSNGQVVIRLGGWMKN